MYASRCTFLHQHRSGKRLLTPVTPAPPSASCRVCGGAEARLWCDLATFTLLDLVETVLKRRFAMIHPSLLAGSFFYEEGDDLDDDERAFNARNLDRPLADLPGGAVGDGAVLEVSDAAQNVSFKLRVRNKSDWTEEDEDAHPDRCIVEEGEVSGGRPEAKREGDAAAQMATDEGTNGKGAADRAAGGPAGGGSGGEDSGEIEILDAQEEEEEGGEEEKAGADAAAALAVVSSGERPEAVPVSSSSLVHVAESSEEAGEAPSAATPDSKRPREEAEVQGGEEGEGRDERAKRARAEEGEAQAGGCAEETAEVIVEDDDVIVIDD